MQIELWEIERVRPYAGNPRVISREAVESLAGAIERFGWTAPILVDEQGEILAGHRRHLAAHHLKLAIVPVICIDGLSDSDKRAYRLADNRLAEGTGWDEVMLGVELQLMADLGADLTGLGFDDELAKLLPAGALDEIEIATEPKEIEATAEPVQSAEAKTCPHCGGAL